MTWFIWSVGSIWFNQIQETNHTNQSNQFGLVLYAPPPLVAELVSILVATVTTVMMAGEYSLTRHWLLALDISYKRRMQRDFPDCQGSV